MLLSAENNWLLSASFNSSNLFQSWMWERDWTWLDAPNISKAKSSKPFQTCFLSNLIFKGCQWSVPRLRMRQKLFRLSAACRSWRVKLPGRRLPSGTQWKNAFWEIGVLLIDVDFMLILCMCACMNPDETSPSIMFLYIYNLMYTHAQATWCLRKL